MKIFLKFVFIAPLLLITGCEKYIGFQYEAPSSHKIARITGKITNTFTGEPVPDANVIFGYQQTVTDKYGKYKIDYLLRDDDQRDKPVPVEISAFNYNTKTSELIIFPQETTLDATLDYAAPIIRKYYYGVGIDYTTYEVMVQDYQGVGDIRSVIVVFYYRKEGESEYLGVYMNAEYRRSVNATTAIYAFTNLTKIENGWSIKPEKQKIRAEDYEAHSDEINERYTNLRSDEPLL